MQPMSTLLWIVALVLVVIGLVIIRFEDWIRRNLDSSGKYDYQKQGKGLLALGFVALVLSFFA